MTLYASNVRLYGPKGFCAPWLHNYDDVVAKPLSSADGHMGDTGRFYAYWEVEVQKPDLGAVKGGLYEDFFLRVVNWKVDQDSMLVGALPSLNINAGNTNAYPDSNYVFKFMNRSFIDGRGGTVQEHWSGFTVTGDRSAMQRKEGFCPCSTPLTPIEDEMNLTITGTSVLDFSAASPSAGNITCVYTFEFLGAAVLRWPATPGGSSFFPYTASMIWSWGPDDFGQYAKGGYATLYPGTLGNLTFGTDVLDSTLVTANPIFGTTDKIHNGFSAYQFNDISTIGGAYSLPTTLLDTATYTGDYAIPIIPGSGGYLVHRDHSSGYEWFDNVTGQRTDAGPISMQMAPL